MFRQVFLNLIKNAIEADAKKIAINYDGCLRISNDGYIISDDSRKEIFLHFFTTKSTASGVGLSLFCQVFTWMIGMMVKHSVSGLILFKKEWAEEARTSQNSDERESIAEILATVKGDKKGREDRDATCRTSYLVKRKSNSTTR